ncbi:MAG: tRNA (adenosine(37)-N6)-threonylcarbamoyltransferase complex transferase subunit TsaD [Abyssibacter sp.]|nr:tRNA (adenosine(37)-N6)-threonylcarbamoyltransferase complex transferase subunit TsaD [Abyssibacter sp.]
MLTSILGIETSCDETGVAVFDTRRGLLSEALFSQIALHAEHGGVVPELASRDHVRRLSGLVEQALAEAGVERTDVIAYTAGPGLVGALMVGAAFATGLATAWNVGVIPVHHMEGHLLAPLMSGQAPAFPFVALLVSGGHTLLVQVDGIGRYSLLGQTRDDAVGEAFDKTAKLLGLGYPGGPAVARLAMAGDPARFRLPRPMLDKPGLDFSFSGLKTAVYLLAQDEPDAQADIARAFEEAVVETLATKCARALEAAGCRDLLIAGGVAANTRLREALSALPGIRLHTPPLALCTDNGAMIAYAGALRLGDAIAAPTAMHARARWPLDTLAPPAGLT